MDLLSEALEYVIKALAVFGGVYSLIQLIDRLMRKPKISGNVDQYIDGTIVHPEHGRRIFLLLQMFVVNKSLHPTTIRSWNLHVKIGGQWVQGLPAAINRNFNIPDLPLQIDFYSARLYDHCAQHYLEYAKGVHGWLYFHFLDPDMTLEQFKGAQIKLVVTDALGWQYNIYDILRGEGKPSYYPGAGINL